MASSAPSIDNILKQINKTPAKNDTATNKTGSAKTEQLQSKKQRTEIPRGQPKSGRPWKTPKQKFSNVKKSLHRRTFEKKLELRHELKHIKELSQSIKDAKKEDNEMKKKRREENAQKRLENERKSEIVQVIHNPAKLKRMKKKQLRMIEKRDLAKIKVV